MIVPTRVPQEATVMAQWSRWFSLLIVLLFLTACTSESALNPVDTAVPQAAEPPAELSDAEPECGRLCTTGFWLVANESEVQAELDGGADPNGVGMLGQTPLGYAVSNNAAPPLVRMLLDAGARVDTVRPTSKRTPLHEAAQHSGVAHKFRINVQRATIYVQRGSTAPTDIPHRCRLMDDGYTNMAASLPFSPRLLQGSLQEDRVV